MGWYLVASCIRIGSFLILTCTIQSGDRRGGACRISGPFRRSSSGSPALVGLLEESLRAIGACRQGNGDILPPTSQIQDRLLKLNKRRTPLSSLKAVYFLLCLKTYNRA
ncbi:hypothetical protein MHYP_G00321480 [Metynnis hypsauchen]